MRHTEFWARMDAALGRGVRPRLGRLIVVRDLDGRTAQEALAAGVPPKEVWAAVWRALELPDRWTGDHPGAEASTSRRSSVARSAPWSSSQAVGAVGITIGIATASLLARDISGIERRPASPRPSRCSAPR